MSPRTGSFLQLLSLAVLAWVGCRALAQWHVGLVVLLLLAAFSNVRAAEMFAAESSLNSELLNALSEIMLCHMPSDDVQAEVVVLVMKKEAAAHGVTLSRIDPEIIASQVLQITDQHGFALVAERVKKLLRKPLLAAHEHDQKLLSLRVRTAQPALAGVPA